MGGLYFRWGGGGGSFLSGGGSHHGRALVLMGGRGGGFKKNCRMEAGGVPPMPPALWETLSTPAMLGPRVATNL